MKELIVNANDNNLSKVLDFIGEQLDTKDFSMKTRMQIEIAVEEIFVNISHYSYGEEEGKATIRFDFRDSDGAAEITFIDSGVPYNPLEKEDPDITKPSSEREIGGLGIFMVKKSMDEMYYKFEDNCNILTIVKKL